MGYIDFSELERIWGALGTVAAEEILGSLLAMAYPKIFMAGMEIEKPISKSGCDS